MKSINSLASVLSLPILLLVITSCSKPSDSSNPNSSHPPDAPTTLTLKADTALYNGSSTITVTTDGQSVKEGNNQVINGSVTISNLKRDTTLIFIATNTNQYGSSSKSASITVKVYSEKTTQLQSYTPLHCTFSKSCIDGAQNSFPIVWVADGLVFYNGFWIKFYANGGAQNNSGTYPPNTGWAWKDNETAIDFWPLTPSVEVWKVTLKSNGFERSQIKNGFYTLQIFEQ